MCKTSEGIGGDWLRGGCFREREKERMGPSEGSLLRLGTMAVQGEAELFLHWIPQRD